MGARGRGPECGRAVPSPVCAAGREALNAPLVGTGTGPGTGTAAGTGDRKTSGGAGALRRRDFRAGAPASSRPGKGFREGVRRPPALGAREEGLPVLKGPFRGRSGRRECLCRCSERRTPENDPVLPPHARDLGAARFNKPLALSGRRRGCSTFGSRESPPHAVTPAEERLLLLSRESPPPSRRLP